MQSRANEPIYYQLQEDNKFSRGRAGGKGGSREAERTRKNEQTIQQTKTVCNNII